MLDNRNVNHYIGYIYWDHSLVGSRSIDSVRLWGCTTLKIGKPSFYRSSVTPRSLRRLHWMLIPGHCEKGVDQPMKARAGALQ